jgi:predicted DNA-binding protein
MKKMTDPVLSVRLPKELDERLARAAKRLDLSKNDIARHAIRAAVTAVEAVEFQVQLPLVMEVKTRSL